ncbi:hypothetical protein IPH92_03780 [Candidatus Kaiserbacteria bacterium]|nr:MAG: hypothetical protein IPH92_03780 [Candidatus Kaiserbacteria bacterium]
MCKVSIGIIVLVVILYAILFFVNTYYRGMYNNKDIQISDIPQNETEEQIDGDYQNFEILGSTTDEQVQATSGMPMIVPSLENNAATTSLYNDDLTPKTQKTEIIIDLLPK